MAWSAEKRVRVDLRKVKARKDAIVANSRSRNEAWVGSMKGCTLIYGTARFESHDRLRVGDDLLATKHVFLNVGARPRIPAFPGVDRVPFLTSTTILDLEELPEHLVVVGGSYVGLEFAQMFRRFGSKVTVVERNTTLLSTEDPDARDGVREALQAEGIDFRLRAECIRLHPWNRGTCGACQLHRGQSGSRGLHVLLAVGRQPNTDDLALERAGLSADSRGYIEVDDQLRTIVEGIWALGRLQWPWRLYPYLLQRL